jgi:hypothetical protein
MASLSPRKVKSTTGIMRPTVQTARDANLTIEMCDELSREKNRRVVLAGAHGRHTPTKARA